MLPSGVVCNEGVDPLDSDWFRRPVSFAVDANALAATVAAIDIHITLATDDVVNVFQSDIGMLIIDPIAREREPGRKRSYVS